MKKHILLIGIASISIAMLGWLTDAGWFEPIARFIAERSSHIAPLAIVIVIAILGLEYRTWFTQNCRCHGRVPSLSAKKIVELAATSVLTIATAVLFAQLIAKAYAMSYTLLSSSSEVKETKTVAIGDFDNDGDLDYIAGNSGAGVNPVDFYANNGNGSFTHSDIGDLPEHAGFVLGDINGDGRLDFIDGVAGYKYTNNGSNSFTEESIADLTSGVSIVLIDAENDGDLDIVFGKTSTNTDSLLKNDGAGTFTGEASSVPRADYMSAADFNSDGYIDIVISNTSADTTKVLTNDGTGQFSESFSTSTSSAGPLQVGDLDGDGDIDFIARSGGAATVKPYLNNGAGTSFTAGTGFGGMVTATSIALGDLDNDGDLDAVLGGADAASQTNGGNEIYLNDGTGIFTQSGTPTEEDDCTNAVALIDVNSDGDLDYVAGNEECGAGTSGRANRIYASDQSATSANTAPSAPTSNFSTAKVSDNGSTATLRLTWGSGSDSQTNTRMLQYILRAGTGSLYNKEISGIVGAPGYRNRLLPNGQSRTFLLKEFPCGTSLVWSVATIDTGLQKSSFSSEQEFALNTDCSVVDQTPIFHWKFDEGTGTSAADSSGGGATMTLTNSAWTSAVPGRIQFSNPYAFSLSDTAEGQATGVSYINGIQKFTQSVWMKTTTKPAVGSTLGYFHNIVMMATAGQGTGGFDKGLSINTAGQADFYVYDGSRIHLAGGNDLSDGGWHHIVGTYDGEKVRLYVDGSFIGTLDAASTSSTSNYVVVNFYGTAETEGYVSSDRFSGAIDDLRIYERTLSQGEITNLWNGCSGTITCTADAGDSGGGVASFVQLLRDQMKKKEEEEAAQRGIVKGMVYLDANRNSMRDERETLGIESVEVKIRGISGREEEISMSTTTTPQGIFTFSLPPTGNSGYTISINTDSSALGNYLPTTDTLTGGILVSANGTTVFDFGWQKKQQALVPVAVYRPCLVIGSGPVEEAMGESEQLLSRLIDPYDQLMMEGLTLERTIVSRSSFVDLLSRVQCDPVPTRIEDLYALSREVQKKDGMSLPEDLHPSLTNVESLRALLILQKDGKFPRVIDGARYMDLQSPISRREALELTANILGVSGSGAVVGSGARIPFDLKTTDPLARTYLRLQELKVLPESFWPLLAPHAGLSAEDAAVIATKLSFIKGKIGLLPAIEQPAENEEVTHGSGETPSTGETSTAFIPHLPDRSCLIVDRKRATTLSFTDIFPGDPLYDDTNLLLQFGTKNSEGQTLWLLPGQPELEHGVTVGRIALRRNDEVSIVELLRMLEVFTCNPPRTSADVAKNPLGEIGGSAVNLLNRERIANLDRTDTSLASRVLFRAQDHERAFDLWLLGFAPHIIRDAYRNPQESFSLHEAADIIASALLYIQVKEQKVSPQAAVLQAQDIALAVLEKLAGRSLDWRDEIATSNTPLTRGNLISVLAAILRQSEEIQLRTTTETVPSGEQWWQRLWPVSEAVLQIDETEQQKLKSAIEEQEQIRWIPTAPSKSTY